MEFKRGAGIYTAEGEHVGEIHRVVIEPGSNGVTHLVIQKGVLFPEERVLPISLVVAANDDKVTLRPGIGDLNELPKYQQSHYVAAEYAMPTAQPTPGVGEIYWYPPVGGGWMTGTPEEEPGSKFVEGSGKNIPEDAVAIREGAEVISRDEESIGDIERIITDSVTDRVTHVLISRGLILKEEKVVPAIWISDISEERVKLSVSSEVMESLPAYDE